MEYETAGDPMSDLKWTRKTTEKISKELESIDIYVSKPTVGKLLKKLDFSLKSNSKKISNGGKSVKENRKWIEEKFSVVLETYGDRAYIILTDSRMNTNYLKYKIHIIGKTRVKKFVQLQFTGQKNSVILGKFKCTDSRI